MDIKDNSVSILTTEQFGMLQCDFWSYGGADVYMTREQIGLALEYSNPVEYIRKIHNRHKDRLDAMSANMVLSKGVSQTGTPLTDGGPQNTVVYSIEGVMEICRWSRQPKADAFMDFVWAVMKKVLSGELVLASKSAPPAQSLVEVRGALVEIQNELAEHRKWMAAAGRKVTAIQDGVGFLNYYHRRAANAHKDTHWMMTVRPKIKALSKHYGVEQRRILRNIYIEIEDRFGIELEDYQADYNFVNGLDRSSMLNVIDGSRALRRCFDTVVTELLDENEITVDVSLPKRKTIFDEVIEDED